MFLSSILGFFANSTDRLLLGGYVDGTTLGVYSIAFTIYSSISMILNKLISDVSYSAFSEVARERSANLKRSLYRFHTLTASFAYFCAGGLVVSGAPSSDCFTTRRYEQAGWMLEILAVGLMSVPFNLAHSVPAGARLPEDIHQPHCDPWGRHRRASSARVSLFRLARCIVGNRRQASYPSVPPTIYYQIKYDLFDLPKELLLLPTFVAGMIVAVGFNLAVGYWN